MYLPEPGSFLLLGFALGGWGWEAVGPDGEILAESPYQFESAEDCMQDALKQTGIARV